MQTSSTSLRELQGRSTTLCGYAAISFSDLEGLSFGRACASSVFVSYPVMSVDTIRRKKPVFYYSKTFGVMKMVTEKFLLHGLLDSLQEVLVLL